MTVRDTQQQHAGQPMLSSTGVRSGLSPRTRKLRLLAAIAGFTGPVLFTLGWLLAGALTPGYSHVGEPISQLAAIEAPYPVVQQVGFIVLALSTAAVAAGLYQAVQPTPRLGALLMVTGSGAVLLTSVFRDDPMGAVEQSASGALHQATGGAFFVLMVAAVAAFSWRFGRAPDWWHLARFSLVSSIASFVLFLVYGVAISAMHPLAGLARAHSCSRCWPG